MSSTDVHDIHDIHGQLSERYVQDAFHRYLKSSLTQAKVERLLDADLLRSAEADIMITGPALCLYFAALRCTTNPPSVPLPRMNKSAGSPSNSSVDLSLDNCPQVFSRFLRVWVDSVPKIQALTPEDQHDLARLLCNLQPLNSPFERSLSGIAADLRAVAIEISQRRSFQDRLAEDLQAVLDAGQSSNEPRLRVNFVPPPLYDPSPSPSASSSPRTSLVDLPPNTSEGADPSPGLLSPTSPTRPTIPTHPRSRSPSPTSIRPRTPSPTILTEDAPSIDFIRETLYASLYDVLLRHPSLRALLHSDPARAYFASVSLAILNVARTSVTPEGTVIGVLSQELTIDDCPDELKGFLRELGELGRLASEVDTEDTEEAMRLAQTGAEVPVPRMERVVETLEKGIGFVGDQHIQSGSGGDTAMSAIERRDARRSIEGRAVVFSNRINALALGFTRLKSFRERQKEVFRVLGGMDR